MPELLVTCGVAFFVTVFLIHRETVKERETLWRLRFPSHYRRASYDYPGWITRVIARNREEAIDHLIQTSTFAELYQEDIG